MFSAAAVAVLAYLAALLVGAFVSAGVWSYVGARLERLAFRRSHLRCRTGDRLFEKGEFAGAIDAFADAFFLRVVKRDTSLLADIADHHTGLMSRLLSVADEMRRGRARLPSLADLDRLLAERLEVQLDYLRAQKRGTGGGRGTALRLKANDKEVRRALGRLVSEIRASEEKVLYH